MLGCTCRIHLGIQWPRIRCSRAYSQHQHGRLQGLWLTLPIIFSCVPELHAQHKCFKTHVLKRFSFNTKHQFIHVLQSSFLLTQHKTSHQSYASGSMSNTSKHIYIYIYIYIICSWITPNISNKSSCSYAVGYLTQYIKIKHQSNIIINGAHAHKY